MSRVKLICGDCLEEMPKIEAGSVDLILTDPPYGTTACKWDSVIQLEPMWEQLNRIIRGNGAIVMTASQPFTSALITSNIEMFKYCWYWRKSRPSGFVNVKNKPLKDIEDICVFSNGTTANKSNNNMPYYPQGLREVNKKWKRPKRYDSGKGVNPTRNSHKLERTIKFENYPRQILDFNMHNVGQLHPTQKPVALMEYLIRTYTNESDTVLDFTMGSGSTGVAAHNLNRDFIGIEKEKEYFEIAEMRMQEETSQMAMVM